MILVKSAFRMVTRKKLETVAFVLVALIAVIAPASLAIIKDNLKHQVYELFKDISGDVMLTGRIPEEALDKLRELEEVRRADGMTIAFGLLGERRVQVAIMGNNTFDTFLKLYVIKEGRVIKSSNEVLVYRAMFVRGPQELPSVGEDVSLTIISPRGPVELKLKVVGLATGFNHIGPTPFIVVIDGELLNTIMNRTVTAVKLEVSGDLRVLAMKAKSVIEGRGGLVTWHIVNSRDENPVVLIVESAMNVMTLPVLTFIAMTPILSASVGLAIVVRDSRIVAVMKALGVGLRELFVTYSLPWIVRTLLGALLGFITSPFIARWLYLNYFVGEDDISRALYERFGFNLEWGISAYYATLVVGLSFLGALIPLIVAYRVNVVNAISMVGLHAYRAPRIGWSKGRFVILRMWFSDMIARWWKTLGLMLTLGLLLGLSSSGVMLSLGLEEWVGVVKDRSLTFFDAILIVSIAGDWSYVDKLSELLESLEYVKGYYMSIPYSLASSIEGLTFIELRAPIHGDPTIEFPLIEGRYPDGKGEVLVSKGLASYKNLRLGDVLRLRDSFGLTHELKVVGISRVYHDRGFQLLVSWDSFKEITGYKPSLGRASVVKVAVQLEDQAKVEVLLERLREDISTKGPYGVDTLSRDSIAETFKASSTTIKSITAIMSFLASVAATIVASAIVISDISAKSREVAVLTSLGLIDRQVIVGYTLQFLTTTIASIPVAYIVSRAITRLLAERTVNLTGYIEPVTSLEALITTITITPLILTIIASITITAITVRRLDIVRALSDL